MKNQFYLFTVLWLFVCILRTCSTQEAYQKRALDLHNKARQKHHVAALTIDNGLNALALKCASYYANRRTIDHTCPYKKDAGENLASASGSTWSAIQFAELSCKLWYDDEVKLYNYNRPGFSPQTGHFTQMVWKGSKKFGFGVVQLRGFYVSVGLYSPPGNYLGEFRQNVLKP